MPDEYPKIIAERVRSSVTAYWQEYLRVGLNDNGSATIAACRYESLASAEEFTNKSGALNLPDEISGKPVVGVEEEWIVGGELVSNHPGCTYRSDDITRAIDWVRVEGWFPTNALVVELLQAALASAHRGKSARTE